MMLLVLESGIFDFLWSKFHHFLSTGFHFRDLFRNALTDIDEKNGRKVDVLSCWLWLLLKGLCCLWKICICKICVQDTHHWQTCFSLSQAPLPLPKQLFWGGWSIFQVDNQIFKTTGGVELVTHVKAMADAHAEESHKEIADYLGIIHHQHQGSSMISLASGKTCLPDGFLMFWHLKTREIGYNIQRLCLKFTATMIQSALTKL